jgi:hypothetical protein
MLINLRRKRKHLAGFAAAGDVIAGDTHSNEVALVYVPPEDTKALHILGIPELESAINNSSH